MSSSLPLLFDRDSFEQFKEAHPELNSALKIAAISESEFVETYAPDLEGGERQAYRIHQTAVRVQQQAALVWANLKDAASPFLRQTLFNNIPPSFLDQQQQIPGYDRLFGSLDYLECDQLRSVLSPSAYFVDLMRFIESTIGERNIDVPAECRIEHRRPDLFQLRLDAGNTNTLIPYIDLVNEVLETLVTSPDHPDAEAVIETALFPQSLPLNLPLAELRAYLQQLNINLPQLYESFAPDPETIHAVGQRERLSLSPQEFELLGQPLIDDLPRLAEVYGFQTITEALSSLASVDVFLERTGLSRQDLSDLLFQDLDRFEVNAGLSRLFFINAVEDGLGHVQIELGDGNPNDPTQPPTETLLNLSAAKLDRIYRFLKLARRLGWSFADLDWALRSLSVPYRPESVLWFDGLNDFVQVPVPTEVDGDDATPAGLATLQDNFTLEVWVNPSRHQANPILSRGQEDDLDLHFLLCLTADGRVAFYGSAAEDADPVMGVQPLPVGEFTHVAVTVQTDRNQSMVSIYLNGELDQTDRLPAVQVPAGNLEVNIGRNLSDMTFAGLIKEVRVWAGVRSPEAIADNRYRRFSGFEPDLVAYWPLTESHGIELLDHTPYAQHGIPGGAYLVTQPRWMSQDLVLSPLPQRLGNNGYRFNGIDHVLARRGLTGLTASQFTLEAWIYIDAVGQHTIVHLGDASDRSSHLWLGINQQNQLVFRSPALRAGEVRSRSAIALERFTHVAVAVDANALHIYLNGRLDHRQGIPANSLQLQGNDLFIGGDLSGNYFSGIIYEVRLWNYARSALQLNNVLQQAVPPLSPGLIGYWPLTDITGEQAADLSMNGNSLYLGGVPTDVRPTPVTVAPLLPDLPVAVPGTVLWFNGDRDLVVLRQETNFGLGRHPRFTLEFWFRPSRFGQPVNGIQLLFSQGDGEAGLAIYLDQQRLMAIAWCANYELTEVQETVLASAPNTVTDEQWHHVALVHDETQDLDYIEFRGFLDGTALAELSSTHAKSSLSAGQRGYRLSPVGPAYLGYLDDTSISRIQGDYLRVADDRLQSFSGQMADLRLWNQAKTAAAIESDRYHDPRLVGSGLMAYLPLDEGHDVTVTDRVNGYTGQLRGETAVFMATPSLDPELENRYTHYQPSGVDVLNWSNYRYSGLLYVPDIPPGETAGGLGVTFFSRHPEHIDQFYRLQVLWPDGQPSFSLAAHPQGVQSLTLEQDDFPTVEPGTWYAFEIQVTDDRTAERTRMAIAVWPWGTAQPTAPQAVAYDDSDVRITAGTVGLWVAGQQPKTLAARFNTLEVVDLEEEDREAAVRLKATFAQYQPGDNPTGWVDTADRLTPQDATDLFQSLDLNGKTVLGTHSDLAGITTHYAPADGESLTWNHYTYQGKLRFSETDSGLGLTVLSRTPTGVDQYYALRRDAHQPTFHMVAHPIGVQPLMAESDSSLDSGVLPEPETDYRVTIEVEAGAERTRLWAKIWAAGTLEPEDFQIKAVDDSDRRMTAGTVGVWTAGPGTKTFDDLKVLQETLLQEDFSAYEPGDDPVDWLHTDAENSSRAVPELFQIAEEDEALVLGTQSRLHNIHSHYQPADALDWSSYTYTGRMLITPESSGSFDGIGVTFFSRYTDPQAVEDGNHDQYYRLRRFDGQRTFHIAPHPHAARQVDGEGRDTGVNPLANTWYRFLIEAHDTGRRTLIRAKIWPEGTPEPAEFQANTFDDNNSSNRDRRRLTAGTIGFWAARAGDKYFDDILVRRGVYLSADLALDAWMATGARQPFDLDDQLFSVEHIPDHPMWQQVDNLPLLRQPLNLQALQFDGDRQYLALEALQGALTDSFTLEAWLQPSAIDQANPVLSWGPDQWFGLNAEGQITLVADDTRLNGETALATDAFTHVAVTVAADRATLYVNGVEAAEGTVPALGLTAAAPLEVGRSGEQYFGGQLRDLRLWGAVQSDFSVHQRYQTPDLTADTLLAYWSLAEFDSIHTLDTSPQANHLRLGGLASARKPTLFSGDRSTDADFWHQSQVSLSFSTAQDSLDIPAETSTPPQRYTLELWFKLADPTISQRKQVLYHSGDDQQGLVIYAHDGRLYWGGYNVSLGWSGTWLSSDRILANRWHHGALVLDGRSELRPQVLRAYLDGKLVGTGDGVQGSAALSSRLGAAAADLRFHDGLATADDTHLVGAVLELRLWTTARTTAELVAHRYAALTGDEPHLALEWRFDGITKDNLRIGDRSGQGRTVTLDDLDRLQTVEPLAIARLPDIILHRDSLLDLATFRQLMERHRQSGERLAALWHDLRHTGRADGRVLFDQVFNPTGMGTSPWAYHDPARRWDVTGQELPSRDRAIRSRLMGALQVSSNDLDALVRQLSGAETTIALDTPYLLQLYRLAQTPRALRLTLREYHLLLDQVGLSQVESLADLAMLSDRLTDMRRIGISIDDLNFFASDRPSPSDRLPYTDATLRGVADDLANQSIEFLVSPITFISEQISEFEAAEIVDVLRPREDDITIGALTRRYFVDDLGAVSDRYQIPTDLQPLAEVQTWSAPLAALNANLTIDAFGALQAAGFINEYGIILRPDDLDEFSTAFGDTPPNPTVLADIQAVLENQNNRQTTITEILVRYRDEHRNAILASLSDLLGAEPEPLQAVMTYFQSVNEPLSDPARLLQQLINLDEDQPIPTDVLDYLFRLHKILLLVTRFELNAAEIRALLTHPACFSVSDVFSPNLTDLTHLFIFTELKAAFGGESAPLLDVLTLQSESPLVNEAIAQLSGWDVPQLVTLQRHFGAQRPYNRVEHLILLQRGFALAERLRVDISFLIRFTATDDLSLGFYRQQADALLPVLRGLYDDEQWPRVYRPLRDPLAMQKRDALLALAMEDIPADFEGRRSPDLLSDYLLLDVQVNSVVETSRIVQGTAALQQYVQRCLMNLEKGVDPATIPADQWEWIQNYRVWEANRKVFLYPESFIEPELRTDKTPLFEDLEQNLMQGEINQAAVTQAYTHYLNQFMEVANLKIVGSYHHKPLEARENASQDDILFLVGRTQSQPAQFYYRELVNGTQWRPWKAIDLVIDADHVSPVYAFGRLFLFWAELRELSQPMDVGPVTVTPEDEDDRSEQTLEGEGVTQQDIEDYRAERRSIDNQGFLVNDNTGERVQRNVDVFRPMVKYSYLDADQSWIAPQTYLELDQTISAEQAILPNWQRVAAQRVLTLNQEDEVPLERNAQVLELDANTAILNVIPRFDMRRLTWSFWTKLENQRPTGFTGSTRPTSPQITLFDYGYALRATAAANITPVLGLREAVPQAVQQATSTTPNILVNAGRSEEDRNEAINNLQTIIENLQQARDSANETTNPNLMDEVTSLVNAIDDLIDAIHDDLRNRTSTALGAANRLLTVAAATPQWETTTWRLTVARTASTSATLLDMNLPYDAWRHIAVTFDYQRRGVYVLNLYVGDDQVDTASVLRDTGNLGELLPSAQVLSIGRPIAEAIAVSTLAIATRDQVAPAPLNTFFTVQLSEFRLWEQVRDLADISASRYERVSGREVGLFYRSLNRPPLINIYSGALRTLLGNRNTLVTSSLSFELTAILPIDVDRERIILFYGNQVRSIRNNLEEQSFTLQLENRFEDITNYDVNVSLFSAGADNSSLPNSRGLILHLSLTNGLSLNDYADGEHSTLNRFTPASLRALQEHLHSLSFLNISRQIATIVQDLQDEQEFAGRNFLLRNLPRYEASVIDVGNQPGWYILDTGDEQFLIQADIDNLKTAAERIRFEYAQSDLGDVRQHIKLYFDRDEALEAIDPTRDANLPRFRFVRLSTFAVHDLSLKLFTQGLDGLLSLQAQQTEELDFNSYQPFTYDPDSGLGLVLAEDIPSTIDFDGAYGLYYREIFFYIPFLIANQLSTNQSFADAQRWYHYIFNPTASESNRGTGLNPDRFWQYWPLRNLSLETLRQMLENEAALAEYQNDPFNPHAIARLRLNAYQKAIVMRYITNLLDWADNLFAQDNRESINQAFLLYVLAFNLLGPRPEARASQQFEEVGDYQGIREAFEETPDFLTELDLNGNVAARTSTITLNQNGNIITTFCVPENSDFIGFWDRVEDRLFKIRHSLNIEGVFRQLALFQPPLDVRALVQAAATGGRDIGSLLADLNVPVPHYRYSFMLERAKEMIGNVQTFGAALLDVLEKRDAEQLTMLENTHERNLLDLTTAVREAAVDAARETIAVLGISRQRILNRRDYFQALTDSGLNDEELAELVLMGIAQATRFVAVPLAAIVGTLRTLPKVETGAVAVLPFATASIDGDQAAGLADAARQIAEVTADTIDTAAAMTAKVGEYKRREQEWRLELRTSEFDLDDINQQIEIAQIQLQMAEQELDIHNRQIEQNREIAQFHRRKFGNEALYNWMVSRLSGLYFQSYKLAYDFAKSAERALQYELPTNQRFIHFGHWDSLRRGLLAGESLMLDVNRMEKFHLDNDSRFLEIEKTIPLSDVDDLALAQLLASGQCEFRLSEALFNRDYPGHYFRVIVTMALTLKFREGSNLATDPYLTINASLTQVGSKTLLEPDIDAVRYLLGLDGAAQPASNTLRVNWRVNQRIAVSKPQLDNGLFVGFNLNFAFEDRYVPFEGTGAVSHWQLEIPHETNPVLVGDIEDVIIHLRYTANSDRSQFKTQVQEAMAELAQ
ncbi:LamG-like jellyroll fold domain-containing protein [Leptolyngbya sp. CCY15150]|uniref:LamG-like jellyroll fold domain-containing protein n=1 Tax=Leptolyngbya sp. CCY15150 TaxID=2767772 RepID=UPI00194F9450|nr:LamG-like jellyroll fold domain-containing protein [Leptolyngbya sp. CCY15150]